MVLLHLLSGFVISNVITGLIKNVCEVYSQAFFLDIGGGLWDDCSLLFDWVQGREIEKKSPTDFSILPGLGMVEGLEERVPNELLRNSYVWV